MSPRATAIQVRSATGPDASRRGRHRFAAAAEEWNPAAAARRRCRDCGWVDPASDSCRQYLPPGSRSSPPAPQSRSRPPSCGHRCAAISDETFRARRSRSAGSNQSDSRCCSPRIALTTISADGEAIRSHSCAAGNAFLPASRFQQPDNQGSSPWASSQCAATCRSRVAAQCRHPRTTVN